jgi:hypothetical protein
MGTQSSSSAGPEVLAGFSLGSYLLVIDYTGGLFREGESAISAKFAGTLDRLGRSAESWRGRLEKITSIPLGAKRHRATRRKCRHAPRETHNPMRCPAFFTVIPFFSWQDRLKCGTINC